MSTQRENDHILGDMTEDLIEILITEQYGSKPFKTPNNHPFDFYNDEYLFEVKARRCNHNTYPTTMIGYNKIEYAKQSNKKVIFIFSFVDGIYKYTYDKNDNFDIKIGGRNDRGYMERQDYYYIPISKLLKID